MAIRLHESDEGGSWLVFTDLTVGLFTLFIMAFLGMATLKHQRDSDFTRKEAEFRELENRYKRMATERNALLSKSLKASIEKGLVALDDGKIQIQASVLFPNGSAALTEGGKDVLSQIAKGMAGILDSSEVVMVAGFTDDTPIQSETYTNWELSAERATTVVRTLVGQGFPADRLFAAGFGEHHPRLPNDKPENRTLNRRVEISVAPIRKTGGWETPGVSGAH